MLKMRTVKTMSKPSLPNRVLLLATLISSASAADKPLSVCEVLSNLKAYRGKVVTVMGLLGGGSRHGWVLRDSVKNEPCAHVEAQGHAWPPSIALAEFTKGSDLEGGPANFESDTKQIEGMLSEPERIAQGREDLIVMVTFVGELRSRKRINIQRSKDGWYVGDGYAQGGQYPALLVLQTARDARVIPKTEAKR